ncbi:hypothetical protein EVAR_76333_1 [Eumeta japonica]|uniref:Uncharacterized protein n=1 Tax=Eumeta variegata TaxID=151549 RepID=A0A4C1T7T2_EUMVA|nr:hypothetical protein EVAR_76333_1 [Eumeta japonica]
MWTSRNHILDIAPGGMLPKRGKEKRLSRFSIQAGFDTHQHGPEKYKCGRTIVGAEYCHLHSSEYYRLSVKSLMYKEQTRRPYIQPRGIPPFTDFGCEHVPSIATLLFRPVRKLPIFSRDEATRS